MQAEIQRNLKWNYIANVLDGAFFGLAFGFASFSTVIPLFVSTLTHSAILIGLVAAVHTLGWQLPQLLMARHTARQPRYKPLVAILTIQERLPFAGLVLVALLLPKIGPTLGIIFTFAMLVWQGLGAGFTANPWQVMIHKVILPDYLATFFGVQGAAANLLASGGAIVAGVILERIAYPYNYAATFSIACVWLTVSWFCVNATREPPHVVDDSVFAQSSLWTNMLSILRSDRNFVWLLVSRVLSQFGTMGFSFYAVHVVNNLGATEFQAGLMTSVLMATQVVMNIGMGWLADRWSRKGVLEIGLISMGLSALTAWFAPSFNWFYAVMLFTGTASTALWTIMMAFTLQFGNDESRPTYIGMANTLISPFTILAPLIGGWLANEAGYTSTFLASAACAVAAIFCLHFTVRDPKKALKPADQPSQLSEPDSAA